MRTFFTLAFIFIAALPASAANFPYIRLNGKTNIISDNGTNLTYNGSGIGGGSGQPASATLTNLSNGIGTGLTNLLGSAVQAAQTNIVTTNFVAKTGDTMTGALKIPDGSAAAPAIRVTSQATGLFTDDAGASLNFSALGLKVGAMNSSVWYPGSLPIAWASGMAAAPDTFLQRDAANTLALRNGANAQTLRVYKTYTDPANYTALSLDFSNGQAFVGTSGLGTGGLGSEGFLQLHGYNGIYFQSQSSYRWFLSDTGNFLAYNDNTYDIGASGANRPRHLFVASNLTVGNLLDLRDQVQIAPAADGVLALFNFATTDFNRLQFGGTTSAFPSIKRNGTALEARLADDSNYAPLNAPWQQSGYSKVLTSTTAADFLYISVPNTNMIGGRVLYTVSATDGSDAQQITGTVQFGAVGKGTAVTANISDVQNTSTVSGGTLTAVLAKNTATNNVFALGLTATTSLTTTNLVIKWRLETPSTYTVNPL